MRTAAIASLVLIACGSDPSAPSPSPSSSPPSEHPTPPPAQQPVDPAPPPGALLEADIANCTPTPMTIPASGVSLSLSLDTRSLHRAHFAASAHTPSDGDPSSFVLTLRESGAPIVDGWDVCVGASPTSCFANLEMDPGVSRRSFVLEIHPRASAAIDATVNVCVLDPLE